MRKYLKIVTGNSLGFKGTRGLPAGETVKLDALCPLWINLLKILITIKKYIQKPTGTNIENNYYTER